MYAQCPRNAPDRSWIHPPPEAYLPCCHDAPVSALASMHQTNEAPDSYGTDRTGTRCAGRTAMSVRPSPVSFHSGLKAGSKNSNIPAPWCARLSQASNPMRRNTTCVFIVSRPVFSVLWLLSFVHRHVCGASLESWADETKTRNSISEIFSILN